MWVDHFSQVIIMWVVVIVVSQLLVIITSYSVTLPNMGRKCRQSVTTRIFHTQVQVVTPPPTKEQS